MKKLSIIIVSILVLISSSCNSAVGIFGKTGSADDLIKLALNIPGLPKDFVNTGYSAGLQNGLNIVSYYTSQDKTKSLMVNIFGSPVTFENPNMNPILNFRVEDAINDAPVIGDSSRLYIQNELYQLVFIDGTIRVMLIGNGLKEPEVIKIARALASSLPAKVSIPISLPKSGKELDSILYDRYFKSSVLFISDQDGKSVEAIICPEKAYISYNFDLKEQLPAWKIQLMDVNQNVINEMAKGGADPKNTALVLPAPISAGEYEVLFYINETLVYDNHIRCGK